MTSDRPALRGYFSSARIFSLFTSRGVSLVVGRVISIAGVGDLHLWPLWPAGDQRIVSSGYVEPRMVCSHAATGSHNDLCADRFDLHPLCRARAGRRPQPQDSLGSVGCGFLWSAAALGVAELPKWLRSIIYVLAGWSGVLTLPELLEKVNESGLLVLYGGVAYTVGAVFYALKRPNLLPGVFGYHELFHVLVLVGAALHYWSVFGVVTGV